MLERSKTEHDQLDKSTTETHERSGEETVEIPLPEGVPQLSRCEIDPEMYRVFAYAVLGWHRRLPKAGGDMCRCGSPWLSCQYVDLADKLLWTGSAAWTTT
jgi:hypothetical protein